MRYIFLWAALLLSQPVAAGDNPSDDAIAAIGLPEAQFRSMLTQVVFSTQTVRMAVYALGIPKACAVVRPAFDAAIALNLPAWRANLVRAYRTNIPPAALSKAAGDGAVVGAATIRPYLGQVSEQMQRDSEPLLKTAALDIVRPVSDAAAQIDGSKIDLRKRTTELEKGINDGSMFCGLNATPAIKK